MASKKRLEANRRNAQKSTGPRTAEGKARAARNATTHGLTAKPEEDTSEAGKAEYRERLARWVDDLRPVGETQEALVEAACHAAWRLERCRRHDRAATGVRLRHALDRPDAEAGAGAESVGRPLIEGPGGQPGTIGPASGRHAEGDDPGTRRDR